MSEKFKPVHYCEGHHGYVRYPKLDRRFVGKQQDGRRWLMARTCPRCLDKIYQLQRAINLTRE